MNTENYILVQLFCTQTEIKQSFIANLNDYGFLALATI